MKSLGGDHTAMVLSDEGLQALCTAVHPTSWWRYPKDPGYTIQIPAVHPRGLGLSDRFQTSPLSIP